MNVKLALKSAAVSLALAFAAITASGAEPVTNYVPSDASAVVYVNFGTLLKSPAFGGVMESFGLNFEEMLGELGLADAKDEDNQAVLFVESADRGGLVINAKGQTDDLKKILLADEDSDEIKKIEFDGAEVYELKDEPHKFHGFVSFLPDDQVQILLGEDMDMKPALFETVEAAPALVRSLKADESIFAIALDAASFLKQLTAEIEKRADSSEEIAALAGSLGDADEMAKDVKALVFRIAPGADSSLDLFLTIRFTNDNTRAEVVKQLESLKTMLTPAEGEDPNEAAKFLESLNIETKGNDAVVSLNISADSIQEAVQAGMAAAAGAMEGGLGGESAGGKAVASGDKEPDFEAMVPLEETPDPDEEGIDEEERAKRVLMRDEAVQRREQKIAELRAEYERGAETRRLNKEMFGYLKEKEWDRAFDAITNGADVNAKDEKGRTPAFYCVESGNFTILNNLDKAGKNKVDPNAVDNAGMSLLHCAVLKKQEAIITYLLKVRACSPRTQIAKTGASPLYDAARAGTYDMVKSLVTYGADPNVARKDGLTPLHQAAARGNLDMVKDLVQAGADVNAIAENGRTPIFYAAARGKASTVNFLIEKKAEINLSDKDGMTPLHCAAASGNVALVKFLVSKKANFAATANDGTTVLISGAKYPEIVKFLADKMPNVNGVDKDGNSVMHLCAETADEETVRKLLFYSAKEDLPNKKGETPILLAARAGNVDMVKRLLNMNVKVTQKIVDEAKTDEIKKLLSAKLKK
jgi:ankyrin repeat protein